MGLTTNYQIPYPALTDKPDGAGQMQALAEQVDTKMKVIDDRRIVATSATRPSPTAGKMLFETDTNRYLYGISVASTNYWVPMPGTLVFSVRQTANQSIPDAVFTGINYQAIDLDPFAFWAAGSPTRFTPRFPGWFEMTGAVSFASNATPYRACMWAKNGALTGPASQVNSQPVGNFNSSMVARVFPIYLNGTTDYMELMALQSSGAAINTLATTVAYQPTMHAKYLGP